jgi:hypothetical protein
MIPRQPPNPDEVAPDDVRNVVREALNDPAPVREPRSQQADDRIAQEEEDRVAAYLRGPTAFTA